MGKDFRRENKIISALDFLYGKNELPRVVAKTAIRLSTNKDLERRKAKAYKLLASLGITAELPKHPEDIFYLGAPADPAVYDEYAIAIAERAKIAKSKPFKDKAREERLEEDKISILAANALLFVDHKLPQKTEYELIQFLASKWQSSKLSFWLEIRNNQSAVVSAQSFRRELIESELAALEPIVFQQREVDRVLKKELKENVSKPNKPLRKANILKIIDESITSWGSATKNRTSIRPVVIDLSDACSKIRANPRFEASF